jgi:hypothetical protein
MEDYYLIAAILTVALQARKPRGSSKSGGQWRDVWNDYNRFLKELDKNDQSIDKRGINPD